MKKLLSYSLVLISLWALLFNQPVWAAEECVGAGCRSPNISNPLLSKISGLSGVQFFQKLISLALNLLFIGGAIIFVFVFLVGGIRWITAVGDKAGVESAQKMVTNALIGLAILFSVFAIISLIKLLFGIDIMKFQIPTL